MDWSSSSSSSSLSMLTTFNASIRSVGTACTMTLVGIYLHRRGFVVGDGKRTLALIAQQVTIPILLFTKFIDCNQDWSTDPCPDVTQSLKDVWMLSIWPIYVVIVGFITGQLVSYICNTPKHQVKTVLAACAFANSTGLPITLLTVVHANFPSDSNIGKIDPCLFLSVYLLVYPILQWGIGGWLVAPDDDDDVNENENTKITSSPDSTKKKIRSVKIGGETSSLIPNDEQNNNDDNIPINASELQGLTKSVAATAKSLRRSLAHNVLNNKTMNHWYQYSRRGMNETDASLYMSVQEDLYILGDDVNAAVTRSSIMLPPPQQQRQSMMIPFSGSDGGGTTLGGLPPNYGSTNNNAPKTRTATDEGEQMFGMMKTLSCNSLGMDISGDNNQNDINTNNNQNGDAGRWIPSGPTATNDDNNTTTTATATLTSNDSKQQQLYINAVHEKESYTQKSLRQSVALSVKATVEDYQDELIYETLYKIFGRCLQPPVVAALLGMVVAASPLRGLLVDLEYRKDNAPLEWFFDGLYAVGQAAVPINMIILGCNLSASHSYQEELKLKKQLQEEEDAENGIAKDKKMDIEPENSPLLSGKTMAGIVIGKMLVMPVIGFISAYLFREYVWDIPPDISGSFYLVLLIVFLNPTGNNVMVMVELSGGGAKEGLAQVIAYQFMVAPIILSLTLTAAVGFAAES